MYVEKTGSLECGEKKKSKVTNVFQSCINEGYSNRGVKPFLKPW